MADRRFDCTIAMNESSTRRALLGLGLRSLRPLGAALCAASCSRALAVPALSEPVCRTFADADLEPPFIARFNEGAVTFLAASHSVDPDSEVHRAVWWLVTRGGIQTLIVEGKPTGPIDARLVPLQGRSERQGLSESEYAERLAASRGIRVVGGEPRQADVAREVIASGRDPADVLGALITRALRSQAMVGRLSPGEAFEGNVEALVRRFTSETPELAQGRFSYVQWYASRFGVHPLSDPELAERGSPCGPGLASEITNQFSVARNEHLARLIQSAARQSRLGVVFGAGHYFALRRSLARTYGPPVITKAWVG